MECSGAPHDLCNHSLNALIFSDWSLPNLLKNPFYCFTGYATESTTDKTFRLDICIRLSGVKELAQLYKISKSYVKNTSHIALIQCYHISPSYKNATGDVVHTFIADSRYHHVTTFKNVYSKWVWHASLQIQGAIYVSTCWGQNTIQWI